MILMGILRRPGFVSPWAGERCLRKADSAYRYGGEEFTVVLPMTTNEEGIITAERIREEQRKRVSLQCLTNKCTTVSIGVAQYRKQEDIKVFVSRSSDARKKTGKDRIYRINF